MKKTLVLITNYRGAFGNKYLNSKYHSGMDKEVLTELFTQKGYSVSIKNPAELDYDKVDSSVYLYTTTEDEQLLYKSYIQDVVLSLRLGGGVVIPDYHFLHCHHNKVMMELIRKISKSPELKNLQASCFGTYEEFVQYSQLKNKNMPIVVKKAFGASSTGVYLSKNYRNLIEIVKKISKTPSFFSDKKEILRKFKHKNYIPVSSNRGKFITQEFIPGLKGDFKVLIYNDKYYTFSRPNRKNDFRASGSGKKKYTFGSNVIFRDGMLDFAKTVFESFNVPFMSLDIADDGSKFYVIEFQFTGFGTSGQQLSDAYYKFDEDWRLEFSKLPLEEVYAESIHAFIKRNHL